MESKRQLVRTEHMEIRWGDMDAMGHVNNTVYFRYMEQVRVGWLLSLGNSIAATEKEGAVIVNASCTFRKPLVYPGTVEVRMYLSNPGRTSVMSHYELWANGELYADGDSKMVWVDVQANQSKPLPDAVRALCEPHGTQQDRGGH
jgi:acyl-CoA thioester hydrolase